jgi:hypothetical protein
MRWVIVALLLCPAGALAQGKRRKPAPTKKAPAEAEKTEVDVERAGKKKLYRIKTEFVIEGRIQKPNAFYVLQRSTINYDWVDTKQQFLPHILKSVKESPF